MEKPKVYTSAPKLGPFLTLVLLRTAQARGVVECSASQGFSAIAPSDETKNPPTSSDAFRRLAGSTSAPSVRSQPISLAFLRLILTLRSRQMESDRVCRPESPLRSTLTRSGAETTATPCRAPLSARNAVG